MPGDRIAIRTMAYQRRSFLKSPKAKWLVAMLAVLDAAGLYMLVGSYRAEAEQTKAMEAARLQAARAPAALEAPPPPEMIDPPEVADMLQSGTLIVISKPSQHMYVFQDGTLWDSTPISTGKRRHTTPSGIFPILHKRRHHRSNIYSGAPMPYMQRLTWEGIALHAGYVPGYPASHGCVRMPPGFAQALFKLTDTDKTTVVIGDDVLETDMDAQQFALTANLPIRSALAPPPDPKIIELAKARVGQMRTMLASAAPLVPLVKPVEPLTVAAKAPKPPVPAPPPPITPAPGGQTIQLTAAPSQAEAEAYWVQLRNQRPDIGRFAKSVEAAEVNSHRVYRLRISGADAHSYCAKLKSEGIGCLEVS